MMTMRAFNVAKFAFVCVVLLILSITITTIYEQQQENGERGNFISEYENEGPFNTFSFLDNKHGNWRHLSENKVEKLTTLGRILFLDEKHPPPNNNNDKKYKILLWKYGRTIHNRHIRRYSDVDHDPFEYCSVKNCEVTYNDNELPNADIVIVHLHRTKGVHDLPPNASRRSKQQIWAFLTDESPFNTFAYASNKKLAQYNGIFNWSMTYRMDSDIPVPYGRTIIKDAPNDNFHFNVYTWMLSKRTDVLVAIMGSNCGSRNHRWQYVNELKRHIKIDTYGACGTIKCAGHFMVDCPKIHNYRFYLSFENSNCDEYVTEKLWWNAYAKGAIPIVMGASRSGYKELLPPHSYINVDDYATPRDLATYLNYLSSNPSELKKYFQWKKYFRIVNEHGYFQTYSYHYCRVCEALNYNNRSAKVYNDLESFWSKTNDCHRSWDEE